MSAAGCLNFDSDFFDKYAIHSHYLDKGASGNVYGPIQWHDKQLALKQAMFADGSVDDKVRKDIEVKKNIWTSLEHKHLTRIHTVDLNRLPRVMFIVMEFAAGGSLSKTIRSLGSGYKLSIDVVTDWAKQIAGGMLYLHQKNIVHRDLKSSNILLMEPYDIRHSNTMITLKITDFDEVKELEQTITMSLVGTCAYMAPEVLVEQRFCKASDVWSYGVVIWEMLSQNVPHKGLEPRTILCKAIKGELENLPLEQSFPAEFKLLLNRCWKPTCRERLSFNEIFCVLQRMALGQDVTEILKAERMEAVYFRDMPKDYSLTENSDSTIKERMQYGHKKYEEDRAALNEQLKEGARAIYGLPVLDEEVFISRLQRSEIEVYDSTTFNFNRQIVVTGMTNFENVVSCPANKCLYTFDWSYKGQFPAILRIDPYEGKLIKHWEIGEGGGRLSISSDANVILNINNKAKLHEYTADGELIREINLGLGMIKAWHGVKLIGGQYFVCDGDYSDRLGSARLLSLKKNADAVGIIFEAEFHTAFVAGQRKWIGKQVCLKRPIDLSLDREGSILVSDASDKQGVSLSFNLDKPRIFGTWEGFAMNMFRRINR